MEKEFKIEGMPSIVTTTYHGKSYGSIARINIDYNHQPITIESLVESLNKLKELGFEWNGRDYTMGYYDSVEDITLEFKNPKFKPCK